MTLVGSENMGTPQELGRKFMAWLVKEGKAAVSAGLRYLNSDLQQKERSQATGPWTHCSQITHKSVECPTLLSTSSGLSLPQEMAKIVQEQGGCCICTSWTLV